jgi:exodeoxyribonuclease VII large subunit
MLRIRALGEPVVASPPMTEVPLRLVPSAPKPMSVAELNRTIKAGIEERFPTVWVEGEVTACKTAPTGHVYFDLKDEREDARVSVVMFKGSAARSKARIANGERVQLKCKPGLYVPRGQFQVVAELALPAGAGAAAAALQALKERLHAEGLFAPERKRAIPRFPRAVGVVTSASGAAFHDICKEAHRRWPLRIVLSPSIVQGADAPAQVVRALALLQRVPEVEVVIVGRGGGASEDLAAFNDERVARAIAACPVPVISAVGHEVDFTVADLVADARAATPTQAAAMCTPVVWDEERDRLITYKRALWKALKLKITNARLALQRGGVRDARALKIDELGQRLDDLAQRLHAAVRARIDARRAEVVRGERALESAHPRARLAADAQRLAGLSARLGPAVLRRLERRRAGLAEVDARLAHAARRRVERPAQRLAVLGSRLDALSPLKILARGYSVVLHEGRAVTDAGVLAEGDALRVRLDRGEVDATVTGVRR